MKIEYVKGNILNVSTDALVLPANSALKEGSGVSAAIFKAAGRKKLTEACKEIGKCEEGRAVPTMAYDLDADYIIHAVVPKWEDGEHNEYERLCSAYIASLKLADVMGVKSIAFPLLGSGNNGYDLELALEIAMRSIEQFEGESLKKVDLVVFGSRISQLVLDKGYAFVVVPDEYVKSENTKEHNFEAIKKGLAKAGEFFGKKENWMAVIEVAGAIVALVANVKKVMDK